MRNELDSTVRRSAERSVSQSFGRSFIPQALQFVGSWYVSVSRFLPVSLARFGNSCADVPHIFSTRSLLASRVNPVNERNPMCSLVLCTARRFLYVGVLHSSNRIRDSQTRFVRLISQATDDRVTDQATILHTINPLQTLYSLPPWRPLQNHFCVKLLITIDE